MKTTSASQTPLNYKSIPLWRRIPKRAIAISLSLLIKSSLVACAVSSVDPESELGETNDPIVLSGVHLQTSLGGNYVGAQNNGGGAVIATATAAQGWETFFLDDLNGGALSSGDQVTLRTSAGYYFRALNAGGGDLDAVATVAQGWETFTLVKATGAGTIQNGDLVALQAPNGTFVRALQGGGTSVDVRGSALQAWEQFRISGLGTTSNPTTDPTCSAGISNGDACCPASCGACGGSGCGTRPGGADACCTSNVLSSAPSCSGSLPPCVMDSSAPDPTADPTCSTGIRNGDACCPASCGACGGSGCGTRPGGADACCATNVTSSAPSCSGSLPPCTLGQSAPPNTGNRLVNAHFQNQSTGTYSRGDVAADFGSSPSWDNGLSQGRAKIVQEGTSKFLRVTYPAGQYGPSNGGVQFEVDLKGSYNELYLSYRVRFASNFDFVKGGKLPGFVGGSSPSGCTTDRTGGFSARNMWRTGGGVDQYMYFPDRQNRCGDDWYYQLDGSTVKFQRGRWHTVEHRIVMGTAGQGDGILQAWFDGRRALDRRLKWKVSGASYGIDALYFSTFFGGSDSSWAPSSAQQVDFDDFIVSDAPITH